MEARQRRIGLLLLSSAIGLLVADRILFAVTPIWMDVLLLGLSVLCLLGLSGLAAKHNRHTKLRQNRGQTLRFPRIFTFHDETGTRKRPER